MAKKKEKKAAKAAEKQKAQMVGAMIEAKGFDMAHKIWLAGVGAYGKAYDAAADGVGKVSGQGSVLFDDLVKRGEEIEGDVRSRLMSNTAVTKMASQMAKVTSEVNERVSKVTGQVTEQVAKARGKVTDATTDVSETVSKFQEEQRERLEARMQRMRDALGIDKFTGKAKKAEKLHSKLDDLEEQVASLRADSDGADDKVKARVERLSQEIAAVAGKPVKAKKAKKAKAAKPAKAKTKAKAATVVETLTKTDEKGRLTAPIGNADDLKLIKGVGAVLERKLNEAGVFHFWQIAAMKMEQVAELEQDMSFPGRIARDGWVGQAEDFAKASA
jgi:predicted flap endonuclease-1-like 5' DNA nuclease/polyhydroxyalkanoate synthesis regulator phasin